MRFFDPAWHLNNAKKISINYITIAKQCVDQTASEQNIIEIKKADDCQRQEIIWTNVIFIGIFHILAVYTFFKYVLEVKFLTIIWGFFVGGIGGFGITAGVHRLWAHRSYKAKVPLQIILLICYSVAGQNDVYQWVRDHRVHHKFSETDADPHNAKRGLFFSHVGWLMLKKHPEVSRKGKLIDMSDIKNNPLIAFHTRYFLHFKIILCFILPTIIPVYCWNDNWTNAIISQVFVRYVANLNFTWSVNSLAHKWGEKPYDKNIKPTENLAVSIMAMGEGFHNYHHTFPWDYKAAELGNYTFNVTTLWLDLFAKIGWAYDLKTPSKEMINAIVRARGDVYRKYPKTLHAMNDISRL